MMADRVGPLLLLLMSSLAAATTGVSRAALSIAAAGDAADGECACSIAMAALLRTLSLALPGHYPAASNTVRKLLASSPRLKRPPKRKPPPPPRPYPPRTPHRPSNHPSWKPPAQCTTSPGGSWVVCQANTTGIWLSNPYQGTTIRAGSSCETVCGSCQDSSSVGCSRPGHPDFGWSEFDPENIDVLPFHFHVQWTCSKT